MYTVYPKKLMADSHFPYLKLKGLPQFQAPNSPCSMIFHGYWVKPLGRTIIDPIHFGGLMILRSPCHFKSATEKKKNADFDLPSTHIHHDWSQLRWFNLQVDHGELVLEKIEKTWKDPLLTKHGLLETPPFSLMISHVTIYTPLLRRFPLSFSYDSYDSYVLMIFPYRLHIFHGDVPVVSTHQCWTAAVHQLLDAAAYRGFLHRLQVNPRSLAVVHVAPMFLTKEGHASHGIQNKNPDHNKPAV